MLPLSPFTGTVAIRCSPRVFMPLLASTACRRVTTGAAPATPTKLSPHSNAKETRDVPRVGTEGLHISAHSFAAKIGGIFPNVIHARGHVTSPQSS